MAFAVSRVYYKKLARPLKKWNNTDLDEDDGRAYCHQAVKFHKNLVFGIFIVAIKIYLLDALHSQFFMAQSHLICIWCEVVRVIDDIFRERCGEQNNLNVLGKKPWGEIVSDES
jgi:hypothetical protein